MSSMWKQIFSLKMLMMLLLGYASGLPLLLTGSTLQAWMTDAKVDITHIGLFSLVGLPYTLKFLWAPLLDRYHFWPGRRRGWMWAFQLLLALSFVMMSQLNPEESLVTMGAMAFVISFFSASQDIVIDAYRREILKTEELGLGSALYTNGYRLAMLVAGALALYLADGHMSWEHVYMLMGLAMGISILFTCFAPQDLQLDIAPHSLKEAVLGPFQDFFSRKGALVVLSFILLYKMGDTMAGQMTTPFILAQGFTKTDIATIAKTVGLIATIIGGTMGGIFILKMGIIRSLWIFGFFQAVSTLGFAGLLFMDKTIFSLALVIGFENITAGLGTSAYAAFMASMTNKKFTATQYALLTSLMGIPRVLAAAPTGFMVQRMGWGMFFLVCTMIALPGMLLIKSVQKIPASEDFL